jgi:hypothetical protein
MGDGRGLCNDGMIAIIVIAVAVSLLRVRTISLPLKICLAYFIPDKTLENSFSGYVE